MDFRYRGKRCREYTALDDTPANRKRLEKVLSKIEADIAAGTFDYEATFPGSRAGAPQQAAVNASMSRTNATGHIPVGEATAAVSTPSFRTFSEDWMRNHEVEWRRSHITAVQGHAHDALPCFESMSAWTCSDTSTKLSTSLMRAAVAV